MLRGITCVLGIAVSCGVAMADTLHLANGGKLEGKVVERRDGKLHVVLDGAGLDAVPVVIAASEVVRIEPSRTRLEEYTARASALAFVDVEGRLALALWCKEQGLLEPMRRELERVVELDPDHAQARELLGHERVDGRWMGKEQAMAARGLALHEGKWIPAAEAEQLVSEARGRARAEKIQREIDRQVALIALPSAKDRNAARDALVALGKAEQMPELIDVAGQLAKYWKGRHSGSRNVTTEMRAAFAQIQQPIPTRDITLGGTSNVPIRIQLPQQSLISVNTTTVLPGNR